MDVKQEREQDCSPSPTRCGRWNFRFPRWTLFCRRVRVHDSQSEDHKKESNRAVSIEVESPQESIGRRSSSTQYGQEVEEQEKTVPLVPFEEPAGVLTVTIKSCKDLTSFTHVKKGTLAAVRVTFGNLARSTKLQLYKDPMIINGKIHISVQISKEDILGDEDSRVLMVELICVDVHTGVPRIMGNDTISLMEILNKPSTLHKFDLRLQDQKVGTVDAELGFTYGFMGYGYSHQITHSEKTMESVVQKSCFLRCPPPEDESDTHNNEASPSTLPPVDLDSLTQPDSVRGLESAGLVEQSIRTRARLPRLYKHWKALETRQDRLNFLEDLIMKKGPSK